MGKGEVNKMGRGKPDKHNFLVLQNLAISSLVYLSATPRYTSFTVEPEVILFFFCNYY